MTKLIAKGVWVEIHNVILEPGERAPQVPEDTRQTALEMRVKGFLAAPATVGGQAEIMTASGRRLVGRLSKVNPAYQHSFGAPIPELSSLGQELRWLLQTQNPRNETE